MIRIPVVVEGPAPAVTAQEAREAQVFSADDGDAYIDMLLAIAQSQIDGSDGTLGRAIGLQTLELVQPAWCTTEPRRLPLQDYVEPVSDVLSSDGRTRTLRWKAGFQTVPADIKHAIILMAGALREAVPGDAVVKSKTIEGIGRWDYVVSADTAKAMDDAAAKLLRKYRMPRL